VGALVAVEAEVRVATAALHIHFLDQFVLRRNDHVAVFSRTKLVKITRGDEMLVLEDLELFPFSRCQEALPDALRHDDVTAIRNTSGLNGGVRAFIKFSFKVTLVALSTGSVAALSNRKEISRLYLVEADGALWLCWFVLLLDRIELKANCSLKIPFLFKVFSSFFQVPLKFH